MQSSERCTNAATSLQKKEGRRASRLARADHTTPRMTSDTLFCLFETQRDRTCLPRRAAIQSSVLNASVRRSDAPRRHATNTGAFPLHSCSMVQNNRPPAFEFYISSETSPSTLYRISRKSRGEIKGEREGRGMPLHGKKMPFVQRDVLLPGGQTKIR